MARVWTIESRLDPLIERVEAEAAPGIEASLKDRINTP
jgi:hypothetical protein